MSDSLEYVTRVPGTSQVVEGKFDKVRGRDVLILTGRFGFKTLDVSDPTSPQLLDTFQPAEILGPNGYWQDEDMDIDVRRNLIIGALDPRHDNVDQVSCPGIGSLGSKTRLPGCRSGFYIISYADPENMEQVGDFVDLPAGHTVSCIDKCNYVWTGGPARRNDQAFLGPFTPGGRGDGRPIWVTDLRNPTRPVVFPDPIDLGRNDGLTDYSHDVDVDDRGIAWVSGRGGLMGYATQGRWRDPRTDEFRNARPWDPILVAGGGVEGGPDGVAQPQTDFIHNAARPLGGEIQAAGVADGNVVLMTEEDFTGPCSASGRIVAADITESLGGEGAANSTPAQPFRLDALSAFHPTQDAGGTTSPSGSCSAHYFEVEGSTVAAAWYGQGLRLIDASERPQPAPGGLLLRYGHRSRDEPELVVVGRGLARRPDLPVRHEPRGRDPAPERRTIGVRAPGDRPRARATRGPTRGATRVRVRADARVAGLPAVRDARQGLKDWRSGVGGPVAAHRRSGDEIVPSDVLPVPHRGIPRAASRADRLVDLRRSR